MLDHIPQKSAGFVQDGSFTLVGNLLSERKNVTDTFYFTKGIAFLTFEYKKILSEKYSFIQKEL